MESGRELIDALEHVSREKGIDKEIIFEAIEASLVSACKRQFGPNSNIRVMVDRSTGEYVVFASKNVTGEVSDDMAEISLEKARDINSTLELGDVVEVIVTPKNFGRISVQTAKQVVVQKVREAEREILYNEYIAKENDIITGVVQRRDRRNVMVDLGRLEGILAPSEQMPRESYMTQDRLRFYVIEVKQNTKGPVVNVSRTHPGLLEKLFVQEVPEVADGIVEIKSVAREAGNRSKIAVFTKHPHVDPIGSCVGPNGQRVNLISAELRGEKIDIIQWHQDPAKFIAGALSPSKVVTVAVNPPDMMARVVVPDHQLSLAIGKEGQNARLAARLTGWRIDIKNESQARGTDFLVFPEAEQTGPTPEELAAQKEMEDSYREFYEDAVLEEDSLPGEEQPSSEEPQPVEEAPTIEEPLPEAPEAEVESEPAAEEYYDEEYYDEEYDDEYYDDEYYDDEYYSEYYEDEYYDEGQYEDTPAAAPAAAPADEG